MRRLTAAVGAVALVAAGAAGGYVVAQVTEDDDAGSGITEAEHDRLVDACVSDYDATAIDCVAWVSEEVATAESEGQTYEDVSRSMADQLAADQAAQAEADADAAARSQERAIRDVCNLVGRTPEECNVPDTAP